MPSEFPLLPSGDGGDDEDEDENDEWFAHGDKHPRFRRDPSCPTLRHFPFFVSSFFLASSVNLQY